MKHFTRLFSISMVKHVPKHLDPNLCCYKKVGLKKQNQQNIIMAYV